MANDFLVLHPLQRRRTAEKGLYVCFVPHCRFAAPENESDMTQIFSTAGAGRIFWMLCVIRIVSHLYIDYSIY